MNITIAKTASTIVREPFLKPFGFKGGYVTEAWQTVCGLQSASGRQAVGLGTQGVLWSDSSVFAGYSESAGNAIMHLMSEYALHLARNASFETPWDLLDQLLPKVFRYGKTISGHKQLRLTFALNALVAVDNAAWMLYAQEHNTESFEALLPPEYQSVLSHRHSQLAVIPLMSYGVSLDEIKRAVNDGYFFLKVKIGSDPDHDGNPEKMLKWDMERLTAIHQLVKDIEIPHTADGHIPYYLDANGRYDTKERLQRLLDYARKIGMVDRILILEEPFDEHLDIEVGDLGVRIAADESAHSVQDAKTRIDMGYGAIALKPIAKTMSMSLRIAKLAADKKIPCFCADLTVIPILVDWNKAVAARLPGLPGMKIGLMETNGHQNYTNWETMRRYHPCYGAKWMETKQGLFHLDDEFFRISGGIFRMPEHYRKLLAL